MSSGNPRSSLTHLSPTLAANEKVAALRARNQRVFHMGFGQSPFPAPPRLVQALQQNAHQRDYLPVAGLPELREAVAAHQSKHTGIDAEQFDVMIAPGSKLLLFAAQLAIPGDLLLPVPSWVSYSPQAALLGQTVIPVISKLSDSGYELNTRILEQTLSNALQEGLNPTKLLINFPNNPAGLTIQSPQLEAITSFCRTHRITLISDEIYGRVDYSNQYRSSASLYPEGTIVTTGLSKHLSLGGWRLGIATIPRQQDGLFETISHIASETWSCVASPIQYAAIEAYAGHADIETFVDSCTAIHQSVNTYIADRLTALDIPCAAPQGGFYTWPDFTQSLSNRFSSSEVMADHLLENHGVVTLPGTCFGETPDRLTLRLAGCDYDGAAALDYFKRTDNSSLAQGIPQFAANVALGMDAFEQFITDLRQSPKSS